MSKVVYRGEDGHDDYRDTLIQRTFFPVKEYRRVPNAPPPAFPSTGMEYLGFVKLERERILETASAPVELANIGKGFGSKSRQTKSRKLFYPSIEWKNEIRYIFYNLRFDLRKKKPFLEEKFPLKSGDNLPQKEDMLGWCAFCLGTELMDKIKSSTSNKRDAKIVEEYVGNVEGHPPFLRFLLALKDEDIVKLLSYHYSWLKSLGFSERQGQWIYALLAVLKRPVDLSTSKLLFNLQDLCLVLLKGLKNKSVYARVPLWLLRSVIREYFDVKSSSGHVKEKLRVEDKLENGLEEVLENENVSKEPEVLEEESSSKGPEVLEEESSSKGPEVLEDEDMSSSESETESEED